MKENDDEEITEDKAETTAEVASKVVICSGSVKHVYEAGKEFL